MYAGWKLSSLLRPLQISASRPHSGINFHRKMTVFQRRNTIDTINTTDNTNSPPNIIFTKTLIISSKKVPGGLLLCNLAYPSKIGICNVTMSAKILYIPQMIKSFPAAPASARRIDGYTNFFLPLMPLAWSSVICRCKERSSTKFRASICVFELSI